MGCFHNTYFLGKLLVLPANGRLDWKVISRYKHSSLFGLVVSDEGKMQMTLTSGPNDIKLFTTVIYCHSMAIPSFCVIKQHYHGNYCRMGVYYRNICVTSVIKHNLTYNGSTIPASF
jgi:hypothetical protein